MTNTTQSFDETLAAYGLPPSGTWSYDWFKFSVPDSKIEDYVTGYSAGGVLAGIILVALSYTVFDRVWSSRSEKYRSIPMEQQVVVIQHSIEAFFLALVFFPMTWAMLSSNFQVPFSEHFDQVRNSFIGIYMVWIVSTYFVELAARYKTIRTLVLVHHVCAAMDALLPLFAMTLVNVRCASVLTYFITFEAPVFMGLVMYRLFPLNAWTPTMIRIGMEVFGLTRPIQLAWILLIVVEHWDTSKAWQCIIQVLFGVFFSCLQLYTLVIHNSLLQKCKRAQREAAAGTAGKPSPTEELSGSEDTTEEYTIMDASARLDEESGLLKPAKMLAILEYDC